MPVRKGGRYETDGGKGKPKRVAHTLPPGSPAPAKPEESAAAETKPRPAAKKETDR